MANMQVLHRIASPYVFVRFSKIAATHDSCNDRAGQIRRVRGPVCGCRFDRPLLVSMLQICKSNLQVAGEFR
jgi:hypothetical protein